MRRRYSGCKFLSSTVLILKGALNPKSEVGIQQRSCARR